MVVESKDADARLAQIKGAVAENVRVVILAQAGTNTTNMAADVGVTPQIVKVRGITAEEANAWLDGIEPACLLEEKECILRYSLGVPLLIERFCNQRPITQASALPLCIIYLQNLIEECHLGGEDRNEKLRQILSEYSDFAIPDDALSKLADCKWARRTNTPISTLHSLLNDGAELPTPVSLQIFELYEEWLRNHADEPSFDVFVQDIQSAEEVLENIGYCECPDRTATLRRFIFADARKGATFFARRGENFSRKMDNSTTDSDSYLYPIIMKLARTLGMNAQLGTKEVFGREVCELQLDGSQKSLFLHKHDHTPRDVMPVAYTVECALQHLGVAYIAQYNDKLFCYDPQKKSYEPVDAKNVDYFRELYGELPDESEQ